MSDNKTATLELGTKPVGKLLLQYALPAVIAMTAASLYNMIDRIFIGQVVGSLAISGLAITFPLMNLSAAFGSAIGIGASTAISVKLGQKDYASAKNVLGNSVTLNIIIGLMFGFVCYIFLDPIILFFGASKETLPYARDFMQVILIGTAISHMYFCMNAILRAASKPKQAMYATMFTVAMNIILDVIFILWWGWGIRGAAFATIISQALALIWQIKLFCNPKELLHLKRGIYQLKSNLVRVIIGIGISPFLMNACACIIVVFMNNQFVRYGGDMAVGAYGISNSIATVFMMFVMGLNQGMQPIAGYNYGAMQTNRVKRVLKLSIIAATIIMTTGWLVGEFAPYYCIRLFTTDATLTRLAMDGLRINLLAFPIVGIQMVTTNFFQCIGKVKISIFLSLSRQLIYLLPLLAILPHFFGIDGVWASLPSSDVIAVATSVSMMMVYMKKFNLKHKKG